MRIKQPFSRKKLEEICTRSKRRQMKIMHMQPILKTTKIKAKTGKMILVKLSKH